MSIKCKGTICVSHLSVTRKSVTCLGLNFYSSSIAPKVKSLIFPRHQFGIFSSSQLSSPDAPSYSMIHLRQNKYVANYPKPCVTQLYYITAFIMWDVIWDDNFQLYPKLNNLDINTNTHTQKKTHSSSLTPFKGECDI